MTRRQPEQVDTEFYLVLVPEWSPNQRDENDRPILRGVKADRITKGRPDTVRGGGVVTKIGIVIDASAFVPLQPEAIIHISQHDVEVVHRIEATSPDVPTDEGETHE